MEMENIPTNSQVREISRERERETEREREE